MIFEFKDYRSILKEELKKRSRINPRYSLRAFARDLGIGISRLSEILRGKQGLSRSYAERIADILKFTTSEKEYFCDLVESFHGRSNFKKEVAKVKLKKYEDFESRQLKQDTYRLISDWYHFAILELCALKGFQNDTNWICQQLDIHYQEGEQAIERMIRLGLLKRENDRLIPSEEFSSTTDGIPSAVIQRSHHQLLQKALKALHEQDVNERNFSAMVMGIDRNKLAKAAEMIKEFRRQFCKEIGEGEDKDAVYCLSVSFFNLTSSERE